MQDGRGAAEALAQHPRQRRHQRDLRHQDDGAAALGEHRRGGAQVDLGLAGAGDPAEQEGGVGALGQRAADRLDAGALVGAQRDRLAGLGRQQVVLELEALHLGEGAHHPEPDQPPHHPFAAGGLGAQLAHRGGAAESGENLHHPPAGPRAAAALEQLVERTRGELHRAGVARAAARPLPHHQPSLLAHAVDGAGEVGAAGLALELRDGGPAGRPQRLDHDRLLLVARDGQGAGVGEPDPPVPPRLELGRQHRLDHLADRLQVVVGDELGELEQIGGEDRPAVDDAVHRPQLDSLGRLRGPVEDDPEEAPPAHPHPGAHPRLGALGQLRRHRVDQRPGDRQRHRHGGEPRRRGRGLGRHLGHRSRV